MDNITIGDDKMNDVEKLKQEYEEEGVAAEWERLIWKVLPEIRIISVSYTHLTLPTILLE